MDYVADFETTTAKINKYESWVYLAGIMNMDGSLFKYFVSLDNFMNYCINLSKRQSVKVYFHKLKWDGEFILHYLVRVLKYANIKKLSPNYFNFSKDDMGNVYWIKIKIYRCYLTFKCSKKILNASVSELGKSLGDEQKGSIDYDKYSHFDSINDIPKELLTYLYHDINIVRRALNEFKTYYNPKITIASTSLATFKKDFGIIKYKSYFENNISKKQWEIYKRGYFGGFSYINPQYFRKIVEKKLYYYDVNSLYPYIMKNELLPYGKPLKYRPYGTYTRLFEINLYHAKLKPNKHPHLHEKTITGKLNYLSETYGKNVVYTEREWELIKTSYDVKYSIKNYWYFRTAPIFKQYLEKLKINKENAKKGSIQYYYHKLILNSLYGKFGQDYKRTHKIFVRKPAKVNKNTVIYGDFIEESETIEKNYLSYLPVALFITSYARCLLVNTIQKYYNNFYYGDTDSVILDCPLPSHLIDDNVFGKWKLENEIEKIKILRVKCYIIQTENNIIIKASGITDDVKVKLNFDNFKIGFEDTRLVANRVKGGTILIDRKITL